MRREVDFLVLALTLTLPMFAVGTPSPAPAQVGSATKDVTIEVACPADLESGTVDIKVTPWVATVVQDQDIQWNLTISGSGNDDIDVLPKSTSQWPYKQPYTPTKSKKQWKDMKPNQKGKQFFYNITVYCGGEKVVIDPRVKVGGG